MHSTSKSGDTIQVDEVVHMLHPQYAIITGGKSKDGCPLITFPDQNNFHLLNDCDYQRLMLYIVSVPSLQETDLGFHVIIDRRNDRWTAVKTVLLRIAEYFPGLIHVVYVLRPISFLQKAISEVSSKLFRDEFKFRVIVLSGDKELHEHIDANQLTADMGGTLMYQHLEWIEQRLALDQFSQQTHHVSDSLDAFTKQISETELPNNVESTEHLLNQQNCEYSKLKDAIIAAAKQGEMLLANIREKSTKHPDSMAFNHSMQTLGNVFAVERLLVQLEETERTFNAFWGNHSVKLQQCLALRRFEQDFKELQGNFDAHLKTINEMTEIGETEQRSETLLREVGAFEKICLVDIERSEEVIECGRQLLHTDDGALLECVEPKCNELQRMQEMLISRLEKRVHFLTKCLDLVKEINKANEWCASGVEMLASQSIDKSNMSIEAATRALESIRTFTSNADDIKCSLEQSPTTETKALVTQVIQRIEDVSLMCEKRMQSLQKIVRPMRPVQSVNPEPIVPRQPLVGAPTPQRMQFKKANTIAEMELGHPTNSLFDGQDDIHTVKQRHVLAELLETERIYVNELSSVLKGYKHAALSQDMQHVIPPDFTDKLDILFGNLDEIHSFHSSVFLKDLQNCISSIELVALCFVQKKEVFNKLYTFYCQNIPRSEQLRESIVDHHNFFQLCQLRLGHKLPLAAYLLKPVQRITKYQLLLADLLKYCEDANSYKQVQAALDCMLLVLKCVNDSMLQISITGFPFDLSAQGDLLLQGAFFSVWAENKRDIRLRIKPMHRHIFLYEKALLFCKTIAKSTHNKQHYQYKHCLQMSQIGLTESVKGDARKFEVWLQGRQEVYTIQASTMDEKHEWVNAIKRVLLNQLEELRGEKIRQYGTASITKLTRHSPSWECHQKMSQQIGNGSTRTFSCDIDLRNNGVADDEIVESVEGNSSWSSDFSNSDGEGEDDDAANSIPNAKYIALADYCAVGTSEVSMREGDVVELLKVGCAGWWFVKSISGSNHQVEGWAPAAYLENMQRKPSRCNNRSQDSVSDRL